VKLSDTGLKVAAQLSDLEEFQPIVKRSNIVVSAVGAFSATRLKEFVYEVFPEIIDMQWGRHIDL
jgi:hypothetical protein